MRPHFQEEHEKKFKPVGDTMADEPNAFLSGFLPKSEIRFFSCEIEANMSITQLLSTKLKISMITFGILIITVTNGRRQEGSFCFLRRGAQDLRLQWDRWNKMMSRRS